MGDYFREHGNDPIVIKLIDLTSVVARLWQLDSQGGWDSDVVVANRLLHDDLARLVRYMPDEAMSEIAGRPFPGEMVSADEMLDRALREIPPPE